MLSFRLLQLVLEAVLVRPHTTQESTTVGCICPVVLRLGQAQRKRISNSAQLRTNSIH